MISTSDYVLWFAHYGCLEAQVRRATDFDDILTWVAGFDNESTGEFDSHGILLGVERVGEGMIADFDQQVEQRRADIEREWQATLAQRKREREANPPPGPTYSIYLKPPSGVGDHLSRYGEHVAGGITGDNLAGEQGRLEELFGADRITVRENKRSA